LSISRSAMLGTLVGLLVILPALPRRARWTVVVAGGLAGVVMFLTVPGLSGTILGLFTGAVSDSSVQSRTGSYPLAWEFIRHAPFFGRGLGTFLPRYRILDNEYLLLTIEIGLLGLASVVILILSGLRAALRASRKQDLDEVSRLVSGGLAAGLAAGGAELLFFDGFSFPMFSALLFAVIGIIGAVDRLSRTPSLEPEQLSSAAVDQNDRPHEA
jgi:O-antigen ligase